jgi:hypothetical protein
MAHTGLNPQESSELTSEEQLNLAFLKETEDKFYKEFYKIGYDLQMCHGHYRYTFRQATDEYKQLHQEEFDFCEFREKMSATTRKFFVFRRTFEKFPQNQTDELHDRSFFELTEAKVFLDLMDLLVDNNKEIFFDNGSIDSKKRLPEYSQVIEKVSEASQRAEKVFECVRNRDFQKIKEIGKLIKSAEAMRLRELEQKRQQNAGEMQDAIVV